MKTFRETLSALRQFAIEFLCLWAAVMGLAGCETVQVPTQTDIQHGQDVAIERIHISALTEFVTVSAQPDKVQLKVVLEFLDAFDLPAPVPCVLRFELYRFHPLSSDPRGKRLILWPEKNLTGVKKADEHWKDLLRGYEFYLPLDFMPRQGKKYVLEATCFADQKRHNDLFKVEVQPIKD
ncbi:MAG: hypothetical protein B6I25_07045 [Planctomycetales bacterium 4572_13]|nr:MAG: hypothetical protein B6I25_07045 [Planctomycetales bacterium 4572_13]